MSQPLQIRAVEASDEVSWRRLWGDYLAFYQSPASDAVYQSTFARLLADGEFEPSGLLAFRNNEAVGLLAFRNNEVVGLVHYIQHRTCWDTRNACYLQDLYCVSRQRGTGGLCQG